MHTARLMADIEDSKRDDVDFAFVARFDTTHDKDTIAYVSRKFNVYTLTTQVPATGHPWGCWGLWFSLADWVYQSVEKKKMPQYDWVFSIEADLVPIRKNWIDELHTEWHEKKVHVLGKWYGNYGPHVNGNMLYSADPKFLRWLVRDIGFGYIKPHQAWDVDMYVKFAPWGAVGTPKIESYYRCPGLSVDEFQRLSARGVSVLHGVRNMDNVNHARKFLVAPARDPQAFIGDGI
jgi:hypothetical protein